MRCFHIFEAGLVCILYIIIHTSGIQVLLCNAGPRQIKICNTEYLGPVEKEQ